MRHTCPICGKRFIGRVASKYCSRECFQKSRTVRKIVCKYCGAKFVSATNKKYCSSECRKLDTVVVNPNESLCWTCQNFAGGCSWSRFFIPIKGWEAKPTKNGLIKQSYIVKKCPEYIKDLPRRKKR